MDDINYAVEVKNQLSAEIQQDKDHWIFVDDEVPEEDTTVLVYTTYDIYAFGRFMGDQWDVKGAPWEADGGSDEEILYWRYLPMAPIENVNIRTTSNDLNSQGKRS
jgi:hypothetical protein